MSSRALTLPLAWVALLSSAVLLSLAPQASALPFSRPGSFFAVVIQSQVFLALFLVPFLSPPQGPLAAALSSALLAALALPLSIPSANVSAAGPGDVVRVEVLVASLAFLASGAAALDVALGGVVRSAWIAVALLLSAALPFLAFLRREVVGLPQAPVLVSPFWAASVPGAPAWTMAAAAAVLGAALHVAAGRRGAAT